MKTKILTIACLIGSVLFAHADEKTSSTEKEFIVKQPDKLFLGAILEAKSLNEDTYEILDVPLNPIKVTPSIPYLYSYFLQPSYENMYESIREKIVDELKESDSFSYFLQECSSYDDLSSYFGQDIDPSFYFGPILKQKDPKHTLLVMDVKQGFFSLHMDLAKNELCAEPELLEGYKDDELIYIGYIQFGRRSLMLIDSPYPSNEVRMAVTDAMNDERETTAKHKAILANSTIRLMLVGNQETNEADTSDPFATLRNFMNKKVTPEDFGIPITFSASYLTNDAVYVNQYRR